MLPERWRVPDPTPPPAPPPQSLPQQLTTGSTEGSPDVSSDRQKVDTEVKEGVVFCLDAVVLQGHPVVELGTRVHLKLARSNIHNMGDAQLGQLAPVPGYVPGGQAWRRWQLGGGDRAPWLSSGGARTCPLPSSATSPKGRDWNQ